MHVGQSQQFSAVGRDQYGDRFPVANLVWTATGGRITQSGLLTAAGIGSMAVSARAGAVEGHAKVIVDPALVNLARRSIATASSEVRENTAAAAIDGDMKTRWESEHADPQWITLDLSEPCQIKRIVIHWEAAAAKAYQVQVSSDNKNWTTLHTETSAAGGDAEHPVDGTGRYVRIHCTERTSTYGYSVFELEVHGFRQAKVGAAP